MKKRILAGVLALVIGFTMMPVTAFAEENNVNQETEQQNVEPNDDSDTGEALLETQALSSWTFMNDGYPYGKNMSSYSVTLVMDVDGTAGSYQWQSAATKDGSYSDISGATRKEYVISSLTNGTWYRCVVDGKASKAVETVYPGKDGRTWTKPYSSWYISNGTMAYMANGTKFDATGLYTKNGTDYMLCTSYTTFWDLYSSSSAEPQATPYRGEDGNAKLDALRVSFNEADAYDLIFEADLASGEKAFSFGCDTQLGNSSTSGGYSDDAALQALMKKTKLRQISMIGAATVDTAANEDPAFVISPVTENSMFWIGQYNYRKAYAYNTKSDTPSHVKTYKTINGEEVATLFEGADSCMNMSWKNVPDGGTVKFKFGVGSVKDTGAINGKVDYVNEKISGLEKNVSYVITIDGEETQYKITSDDKGEIALSGTDQNNQAYDFIGKTITLSREDNPDLEIDLEITGRPEQPQNPSDLENGANKPEIVEKIEITELTTDSVTISPIEGQQYAYSTDGTNWNILNDTNKDSNGHYKVSGLSTGDKVYVRTRISATKSEPASEWSNATELTLMDTIKARVNDYTGAYDGKDHTIAVAPENVSDADVKYSLTIDGVYGTEIPKKKDAGTYTVYYRVEKAGYYPACGSATIKIMPKPLTVKWADTTFKYDGNSKLPTATLEGVLDGDTCTVTVRAEGTESAVNAGTYYAQAMIDHHNYVIGFGEETTFTIERSEQNAPVLTTVAETISGKKDGQIKGLTTEMEYRKITPATAGVASAVSTNAYCPVEQTDMSFESGTYAVRYKENNNYKASSDTIVTVKEGRKLAITLPKKSEQTGYTITCDKTQAGWGEKVKVTFTLKPEGRKNSAFAVLVNGIPVTLSEDGSYTIENITEDPTITVTGVVDMGLVTDEVKKDIEDVTIKAADKDAIKAAFEEELKKSGLENATVEVNDFKKTPAKLHESGMVTSTVEITTDGVTKTVEISKELPKLSTFVNYESAVAEDAPKAEVSVDKNALMDKVLGEKEMEALSDGGNADILLHVQNIGKEADEKDTEIIAAKLADKAQIGKVFDISLFLNVVDAEGNPVVENEKIHEADTMFTIKVKVPNELIASGRTFQIVRVHDGKAEILEAVYDETDNTLTFKTDRFSTYAIAYRDPEQKKDISGDQAASSTGTNYAAATDVKPAASGEANKKLSETPDTGDTNCTWLYILLIAAGAGIVTITMKRKTEKR